MPRRLALSLLVVVAASLLAGSPASALRTHACRGQERFLCGSVPVPLDRSGRVPGTLRLAVAIERPRKGADGWLVALAGGPGQPSVPFADSFRETLAPALAHRRLVVLDGRGTGGSGALRCPGVQALGSLDVVLTRLVEDCARKLGPARQAYATADSVEDLEAVREALGAPGLELMGVSYGTYVAVQYARRHPDRMQGLILDSVVGPNGIDPYFLDTFLRLPRILREQCARGRCRGATGDPMADLAAVTARLARGPLRGIAFDEHGRARRTAIHDESELALIIMSGDLNPWLQNALPAAIAAAADGDAGPLLRLRRPANGPPTAVSDFSVGLNVTTTCADVRLPYGFAAGLADRWAAWLHGTDGLDAAAFAPWSRQAVIDTSVAHDCLRWPQGDVFTPASSAPLPDVPAILLSGRLDTRTPTENARSVLAGLPHGQLLTVPGTGHDVLDADITGCATRALKRWAAGQAIGTPCRGKSNAVATLDRPARSVASYARARGVPGRRGRVVNAVLDTVADAQNTALQTVFAGFTTISAGGLRGGSMGASASVDRVSLRGYELVPGLAVTGTVRAVDGSGKGVLRVDGPGGLDGTLRLAPDGTVRGMLGGRHVRSRRRGSKASAATAGARERVPARLRSAAEVARLVRLAARARAER